MGKGRALSLHHKHIKRKWAEARMDKVNAANRATTAKEDLIRAIESRGNEFFASGLAGVASKLLCDYKTVFLDPQRQREVNLRLTNPRPPPETFRPIESCIPYFILDVPENFSGVLELGVSCQQEEGGEATANIPFDDRASFSAAILYLLSVYRHKESEMDEPKDEVRVIAQLDSTHKTLSEAWQKGTEGTV